MSGVGSVALCSFVLGSSCSVLFSVPQERFFYGLVTILLSPGSRGVRTRLFEGSLCSASVSSVWFRVSGTRLRCVGLSSGLSGIPRSVVLLGFGVDSLRTSGIKLV